MQGKARKGKARKRVTVHGEEIERLRWSVGRGRRGRDAIGTRVLARVGGYGGTMVRGYCVRTGARREGAKRNGAMNRR